MSHHDRTAEDNQRQEESSKPLPATGRTEDTNQSLDEFARWKSWFPAINPALLQSSYERWSRLSVKSNLLHTIVNGHSINFAGAREELAQAAKKLKYDAPYRVVILGESGAGKSTLINALLRRNILAVGAGGAVTGVPVHIHLASEDEQESVAVIYRSDAQTLELVRHFARRYGFESPPSMDELAETVFGKRFGKVLEATALDRETRQQIEKDITDITYVWRSLKEADLVGKSVPCDLSKEGKSLREITEETSKVNAPNSPTRRIPGILRVEYRLKGLSGGGIEETALHNTVLVDTPGIGARTLRHREMLQIEAEEADAVIFVVNASRPEDKTVTMANLVEDTLFLGFSPEERGNLADKMFLVVNQIDKIKTDDDRRRLHISLSQIYQSLLTESARQGSPGSDGQQYIGLNAELGLLARNYKEGVTLGGVEEKTYLGYLANLGIQAPPLTDEVHDMALKKSGLPNLEQRLQSFLGEQRLELMLEEAEIRLKNTVDKIREVCLSIYRKHGLSVDGVTDFSVIGDSHVRKLCSAQLENDRRDMLVAYRSLSEKIYAWRKLPEHQQTLTKKVGEIYRRLDAVLLKCLNELLQFDKELLGSAIDDVTGIEYTEGRLRALLLETENEVRLEIERVARDLASYYSDTFSRYVASERLHNILQRKSYNQEYITKFVDPVGKLERRQELIREEFSQICCWSLIYEFVQLPLLGRARQLSLGYKVWEVVKVFGPALINGGIEATATTAGAPPGTVSFFQTLIRRKGAREMKEAAVQTHQGEVDIASQERQFLDTLENHILAKNFGEFKRLTSEQSSVRYRAAITAALPSLEDLFFFELGKYRRVYEQVVEQMKVEHTAHLSVGGAGSIREMLMQDKSADLYEIGEVTTILNALKELHEV
jgi:GTPase SAR1 family protein